jgi:hypothetical protein
VPSMNSQCSKDQYSLQPSLLSPCTLAIIKPSWVEGSAVRSWTCFTSKPIMVISHPHIEFSLYTTFIVMSRNSVHFSPLPRNRVTVTFTEFSSRVLRDA